MVDAQNIQWFPGHMTKTRRLMQSHLRLVDVAIELLDARIPYSSRNPEVDRILGVKPRLILLNKSDLADQTLTAQWIAHFAKCGLSAIAVDCRSAKGLVKFEGAVRAVLHNEMERRKTKGMSTRNIRMMIVGIPNVGKSSLINRLAGNRRTKVEDRPGVTRGKQWVSIDNGFELLDMPGVLWPKFEDLQVGERLAFTGAIKDNILDLQHLSIRFLQQMSSDYPTLLKARYNLASEIIDSTDGVQILTAISRQRGMLLPGAHVDLERAAITVLDEFRAGKIGQITLDKPTVKTVK